MNGLLEKNASESAPIVTLPIGTYREISLTQGKVAIVDPEDYAYLNNFKWCAFKSRSVFYAVRLIRVNGKQKMLMMHHVVLPRIVGRETDHINHNGLDNRKCNLRQCSRSENQHNRRNQRGKKSSQYKGVYWKKDHHLWLAAVRLNNKIIWRKYFNSEIEAALAYDATARKYYGEFACTNFQQRPQGKQAIIGGK